MKLSPTEDAKLLLRARRMATRIRAAAACKPCKSRKLKCSDYRPCAQCKTSTPLLCLDRTALSDMAASNTCFRPVKVDFHQAPLTITIANWWDRPRDHAIETNSRSASHTLGYSDDCLATLPGQELVGSWGYYPVDAQLQQRSLALDSIPSELSGDMTTAWHPWPSGMGQARAERSGAEAVMGYAEGGGRAEDGRNGFGCWGAVVSPQVRRAARRTHFS
jgi:hypothetical protein